MKAMLFDAVVVAQGRNRAVLPVPVDPDEFWGPKPRHHVAGTVNGRRFRGVIETVDDGFGLVLGASWRRDCGVEPGEQVKVELEPEGPQREDLPPDFAAALQANPVAGEFFDALAQFYRNSYLTWINATKRSPERRAERITTVVELLANGQKTRPNS